jgi:NAD(P)-dependent dehydrogenase (short-subunit alcohol dehydrogenase family)
MALLQTRFAGLADRVAVVTGGARGIGRVIAAELAAQGARVAVLDIAAPADAGALTEPGRRCFIACDVSDERAVDAAFTAIEGALGPPAILVNNAAVLSTGTVEGTTPDQWRRTLDVNVTGAFLASRRALAGMRAAGYGRIVNIGSNSGKMGGSVAVVAYAASKAALHNLSRSIATEQGRNGITANTVAAAVIRTEMAEAAGLDHLVERIPVGRMGRPEEVAYAALFLASSEAAYVTGEVMDVNGGFYLD